ncbi:MAG: hypothetical protein COZ28_01985 [Candidatus Moranbacteria bacterium CG_4_10_14_3_um_filter_44_15]|nr:MAG: hypothetical protein COS72_00590 [Candidatus Moranbacteria bacterium CG06_land_8_20_14_3_00_43_56]PIV83805.1 MAG: hypothetical protein COW51_02685 [Candidatus Moranbacteria bacterium CG17_big_fil_post_rev_8_21_14_2_50_44_12]PIW93134.1 MAG: hypothetical protein COZ87_03160 [Candidatus Moranbacteria bacterium CG_4_8_14_3_um_filter_43_15]PIX90742.1 MAG: hypothetical protein COZ28_01985 [Candidatus Moranbacteria bacterium CG_4_10_14_3_um_filter_44_15]PJA86319.1 MAG: hypothetical protein CO1
MFRGFIRKKVGSYTLGEQLKKFRSDGRITLHEVSRETRIPVKYLEMIEEGKYESLPPDVYVRGFLRSYAEFLGVESKKLISLYARERDIKMNLNGGGKPAAPPKAKYVPRFVVTPKIITAAVIALVVLGGFFYLYKEIGRFAAVPRLVLTQPGSNEASVEGNLITLVGFTDEDAKLTINDQPVVVSDSGEFKEDIFLRRGLNTITINSVNRFGKTATQIINVKSDYQNPEMAVSGKNESGSGGEVSGEQNSKRESGVKVAVRIDSLPTWLSVESDGNLVYSGTMLPGAIQEFKAGSELCLTSGKANQAFIRVNGKAEKILADTPGIVRDIVFTPND